MMIHEKECRAAGLDPAEVAKVARGLSRYAKQAQALGLCVFGGSGTGTLRKDDHPRGALVLANLTPIGVFDGGDGACSAEDDGLLRGEYA